MKDKVLIALGGNALLQAGEKGTDEDQLKHVEETAKHFLDIINEGYKICVTHGNGPQVGAILLQNELASKTIPSMPLDICVADSQGGIGYMIERMIRNVLNKHGIKKNVITMVTLVEVDNNDPAFSNPSKRIGKVYTKTEAEKLSRDKGWIFKPIIYR